jgi:hypothetical protein
MVSYKEKIPAMCVVCKYRDGFECLMHDVDVRKEEWLKGFDGCNSFEEIA